MPIAPDEARKRLLGGLNDRQQGAVGFDRRRLLVIAGAGSGKTEVMARRVAWWVAVEGVPKDDIIAFTFTDPAAEELKFRIRTWLEKVALPEEDPTLGGMYIGTIHGFCLRVLRELAADEYYVFDVLDEAGRISLIEQGYHNILTLRTFEAAAQGVQQASGKFDAINLFLRGYDLLNEYDQLDVELSPQPTPTDVRDERDWCREASLRTNVGTSALARAFAESAARYYAYLRARRFLDFSTVQSELTRKLRTDSNFIERFQGRWRRLVVDEVQDINPVQDCLVRQIVGDAGQLTAVGDHRQAIYAFRGGRVDLMGKLFSELEDAADGAIIELSKNYRSTPRIIKLSNQWSDTVGDTAGMLNPHMDHGRKSRLDVSDKHVGLIHFPDRNAEADWIARTILELVRHEEEPEHGAFHDDKEGPRGITLSDIAILVRSSTDIRTYQDALRDRGVPAVVRGGPDLFSQPEVLLFLSGLAVCSGVDAYFGAPHNRNSLPSRINRLLRVNPDPESVIPAAARLLRNRGLRLPEGVEDRLVLFGRAMRHRLASSDPLPLDLDRLKCTKAKQWLRRNKQPRRVFPQSIFHWLLEEGGIHSWEDERNRDMAEAARFHVGQLSTLVKGMETSGWTTADSLKWQTIALLNWGSGSARTTEAPLLVSPKAVNITTVHSAKGLEYAVVFLADVNARRFPSSRATTVSNVPFDAQLRHVIDPRLLADNNNYDHERRLMYVALTRAERYLFVSANSQQTSRFLRDLVPMVSAVGGTVSNGDIAIGKTLRYYPSCFSREDRLTTSFSDLRYYLECPHDFYLRIVLGFTPTIDQAFGYGRGVHNLLRAVHSDPRKWAELADIPARLETEIKRMVDRGMFYLRYTTGDPLRNLQSKAIEGISEYVKAYAAELAHLEFEPEREFETLVPEENLLISGAIDVVRLDDPPRITILDFKSGDSEAETGSGLTKELMSLQIGVYGLAARHELEYDPQHGLVRYVGEHDPAKRELAVNLDDARLAAVRARIVETGKRIRERRFQEGPSGLVPDRCERCDFLGICDRQEAARARQRR